MPWVSHSTVGPPRLIQEHDLYQKVPLSPRYYPCETHSKARNMTNPYQLLGGAAGVRALCEAFYAIMDAQPEAADIRRMHGSDLGPIKEKLYEYLSGWMGGPPLYQLRHGTMCMTKPHQPYAIGAHERDQWLQCMDLALERIGASAEVKAILQGPMARIADAVRNRNSSAIDPEAAQASG